MNCKHKDEKKRFYELIKKNYKLIEIRKSTNYYIKTCVEFLLLANNFFSKLSNSVIF